MVLSQVDIEMQALTLRDCLSYGDFDLAQRFFSATARQIGPTWTANQVRDRIFAPAQEPRSMRQRVMGWTAKAALNATAYDTALTERFLRVMNLVDPQARLQDPRLLPRILTTNVRYRRAEPRAQAGGQWVERPSVLPVDLGFETGRAAERGRTSRHD
ncbi:hypothetical protein [Mycobacterium sp. TY815]|uniref:hypothetical protein n=1 Tax=Mycobacterium sp. TY815 TaxID=3050581 RepID=UPI0027407F29|nr:hypothetical protein [Mycobacterium sp. TY815]MDP7707369.1 hypothetical protein [Mycobacterium sp. TY815]